MKYDENSISVIKEWYNQVRHRPTVWIKSLGEYGLMHLYKEVITNSLDEYLNSVCTHIEVEINPIGDEIGPYFMVKDNGRGIPIGSIETVLGELHSSGKYADIKGMAAGGYKKAAGLNGVGISLVNAMSDKTICTVNRDGKTGTVEFSRGLITKHLETKPCRSKETGTTIKWYPDLELFGVDKEGLPALYKGYRDYTEVMSYINSGVNISFKWVGANNNKPEIFYHKNGPKDYFNKIARERKMKIIGQPFNIKWNDDQGNYSYNITFGFCTKGGGGVKSFVNGLHMPENGEHVDAFFESMRWLTAYMNKGNFIPKALSKKVKINGNDIRESVYAIVIAETVKPEFGNQTKTIFSGRDYRVGVQEALKNDITKWINENRTTVLPKIGQHLATLAKIRYENQKTRNNILKAGSSRNDLLKDIDMSKFTDANIQDPERTELFLVEGDSAASPIAIARNRDYQALLALRGKVKNMVSGNENSLSDELKSLVKILNIGLGKNKNINHMRYKRVIILTDADDDGAHITGLLIVFFIKFYPELVEQGRVLVANPPLYVINVKGADPIYINTEEDFRNALASRALAVYKGIDSKGKELPRNIFRRYIEYLPDYANMMDVYAKKLVVEDPILIEGIVMGFELLTKGDYDYLSHYGYTVTSFIRENGTIYLSLSSGYNQYDIEINKGFIENIYRPIRKYITDKIKLARIRFKDVEGKTYKGIYYSQGKLIESLTFNSKGVRVKREKGLGSSSIEELRYTCIDPKTRFLTRVKLDDIDNAEKWLKILFTNSDGKKALFSVD